MVTFDDDLLSEEDLDNTDNDNLTMTMKMNIFEENSS